MSVPEEKRRAVQYTREWLFKLLDRRYRPGWTEIRKKASRLLRHYPFDMDIERAFEPAQKTKTWSKPGGKCEWH